MSDLMLWADEPTLTTTLGQLLTNLGTLLTILLGHAVAWAGPLGWAAWWLFAVDWRRLGPSLRAGAWAPCVVLLAAVAFVWSRLVPGPRADLGVELPAFAWQLGHVALYAAGALLCGWLQGIFATAPADVSLEPALAHGHDGYRHRKHEAEVTEPTHLD